MAPTTRLDHLAKNLQLPQKAKLRDAKRARGAHGRPLQTGRQALRSVCLVSKFLTFSSPFALSLRRSPSGYRAKSSANFLISWQVCSTTERKLVHLQRNLCINAVGLDLRNE